MYPPFGCAGVKVGRGLGEKPREGRVLPRRGHGTGASGGIDCFDYSAWNAAIWGGAVSGGALSKSPFGQPVITESQSIRDLAT